MRTALLTVPFGLSAGSVIGAAATRWPAGLDLGRPARSRCDTCGRGLRPIELIPVVSWLVQRGRCRGCAAPIGTSVPLVELGAASMLVLAAAVPPHPVGLLLGAVGAALVLAAALDLAARWIPDRLTLPLGAIVVPLALVTAIAEGSEAAAHEVVRFGLGVPVFLAAVRAASIHLGGRTWFGGGDVKMLVPVLAAAALSPGGPALVGVAAVASGGLVAAVGLLSGRLSRGDSLPFAPFLLVGWTALLVRRLLPGA